MPSTNDTNIQKLKCELQLGAEIFKKSEFALTAKLFEDAYKAICDMERKMDDQKARTEFKNDTDAEVMSHLVFERDQAKALLKLKDDRNDVLMAERDKAIEQGETLRKQIFDFKHTLNDLSAVSVNDVTNDPLYETKSGNTSPDSKIGVYMYSCGIMHGISKALYVFNSIFEDIGEWRGGE